MSYTIHYKNSGRAADAERIAACHDWLGNVRAQKLSDALKSQWVAYRVTFNGRKAFVRNAHFLLNFAGIGSYYDRMALMRDLLRR
jgi:hypothetical protein